MNCMELLDLSSIHCCTSRPMIVCQDVLSKLLDTSWYYRSITARALMDSPPCTPEMPRRTEGSFLGQRKFYQGPVVNHFIQCKGSTSWRVAKIPRGLWRRCELWSSKIQKLTSPSPLMVPCLWVKQWLIHPQLTGRTRWAPMNSQPHHLPSTGSIFGRWKVVTLPSSIVLPLLYHCYTCWLLVDIKMKSSSPKEQWLLLGSNDLRGMLWYFSRILAHSGRSISSSPAWW